MPRSRFRTPVHSFASSSSRNPPLSFRRKTTSTASIQPDKESSDDDEDETTVTASATTTAHTPREIVKECTDVYMSVHVAHEKVGCAVYEFKTGRVSLLEDCLLDVTSSSKVSHQSNSMDEDEDEDSVGELESAMEEDAPARTQSADAVMSILHRFQPDLLLANNRCPEPVLEMLKKELTGLDAVLQIRAAKEFNKDQGLALLLDLQAHISSTAQCKAPQLALEAMSLSLGAAHALLGHLQRHVRLTQGQTNNEDQEEESSSLPVTGIELIALSETMYLSADARKALCIFDEEDHASVHFAKGKEGLSLFGLLNCVQTPMSRALLRRWLLFPSLSVSLLESRLDAVSLFVEKPRLTEQLRKEVKGTQNIHRLAARLVDGKADLTTWRCVYDFASKCLVIRGLCFTLEDDDKEVGIIGAILESFTVDRLQRIRHSIEEVIDWNESRLNQRVCVKVGLDAQLDEWRQVYANLPSILNSIVARMSSELGNVLDRSYDMYIEYFPQVGYLQALCRNDAGETNEDSIRVGEELGWVYQYSSEVKAYFKTQETRDLDGQLGDLYSFIAGREIEIVQGLYQEVGRYLDCLTACSDVVAELDCLLAFAIVAAKNGYARPTVTEDCVLDIEGGRHPLQELIVEAFVANDTAIEGGRGLGASVISGGSFNSVVIITGANACGKSVYLKQCALIVYMAQIGSFVPADSARVGIVDKIFTRMQAVESASTMQSSFLVDMQQVSQALQSCTRQSLVLLDEMGKGTSSTDGASLFAATIKHFLRKGEGCPRILAATHFHEVFHDDYLSSSLPFTPAHMQVLLRQGHNNRLEESITFLYKLRYGLQLTSHAAQCELLCGIPQDIVERAEYVARLSRDHNLQELQMRIRGEMQINVQDGPDQDLQRAEEIARAFVQWDIAEDKEMAAIYGERASLDPRMKLGALVNG